MLPKKIRLETNGNNPRLTKIFDSETGKPVPHVKAIDYKATATSQCMIVTLCGVAMIAQGVDAEYVMTEDDLRAIAARAGFDLVRRARNEA